MTDVPTLETPRLLLRAHRMDDAEAQASLWAEPSVTRFIGGVPLSREAAWNRFLRYAGLWHHLGFGFFAIEDKATGAFIGEAGFHDLRRTLDPSIEGTMEAAWMLCSEAQGKGLAEEAMRAALAWARTNGKGERITCIIQPEHAASLHVAKKLGFTEYARSTYNDLPFVLLDQRRVMGE